MNKKDSDLKLLDEISKQKHLSAKLRAESQRFFCNDNIAELVTLEDREQMIKSLTRKFQEIFEILGIDYQNDHNTQDTPTRIAKSWVNEFFVGRYRAEPALTEFPNEHKYEDIIHIGPIEVKSTCAHHFLPIIGRAHIGLIPKKNLIGLSKYARIVDWFSRRPQIQEELTSQIAQYIQEKISPKGVIVYIRAKHYCMSCRGVNQNDAVTSTTVALGKFEDNENLRREFFRHF